MFKKILVPPDGSRIAEHVLTWSRQYVASFGTPVVLINVLGTMYPIEWMPFGGEEPAAREYLEDGAKTLSHLGIPSALIHALLPR